MSIQDAFALGWKLQAALTGEGGAGLLHSYPAERQAIAQELIDFDKIFAAAFAAGRDAELQRLFQQQGRYTAGVATRYARSTIIGPDTHQALASGFEIGARFHSAPVIRWADGQRMQSRHVHGIDGRWRLYAFAGADQSTVLPLAAWSLGRAVNLRMILRTRHRDTVVDPRTPGLFPQTGTLALRDDYERVFCADPAHDIFAARGIVGDGAAVLVRPDQFVAHVAPLDGRDTLCAFLQGAKA